MTQLSGETPICKKCGSYDLELLYTETRFSTDDTARYECNHCGREWSVTNFQKKREEGVVRHFGKAKRCPKCGGRGKVKSTQGEIRYVKCSEPACGKNWKETSQRMVPVDSELEN